MVNVIVTDMKTKVVVKVTMDQALAMKQMYSQFGLKVYIVNENGFGKVIVK